MDRMRMETPDLVDANIERLADLFPNVVTESRGADGAIRRAVNFDLLRQILSKDLVEGDEAYEFTWVGKRAAILEAGRPIRKTLRPCREESRNWDTTGNLYIEGDNLDALKLLQESYLGRIKMIYIDPPYNTGNDFVYRDSFAMSREDYDEASGVHGEDGERLFRNTEGGGRFHSDWCSMIYPRLMLARNLLSDDGVIFISIDDNEDVNLEKICDEIFGATNFIVKFIWERAYSPKNDAKYVSMSHDYVVMYTKNKTMFEIGRIPRTEEANARYKNPDNDHRGPWKPSDLSVKRYTRGYDYEIETPSGRKVSPPTGRCWGMLKNAFLKLVEDNRIWFGENGDSVPSLKRFVSELKHDGMAPTSILFYKDVGHSQEGSKEVVSLFEGEGHFDGPKPTRLIKRLITLANAKADDIILDFFSGSATTAHAVMQLNAEDGGNRRFIMVQLPEPCPPDSEAARAGHANICEIGKERIRRAGDRIRADLEAKAAAGREQERGLLPDGGSGDSADTPPVPDIGFRVLRVDDTNMKDVHYGAADLRQGDLLDLVGNIREDRSDLDLLFSCILEFHLPLTLSHTEDNVDGAAVHTYAHPSDDPADSPELMACFQEDMTEKVVRHIAGRRPLGAVFRDACFSGSPARINAGEIFKALSPGTVIRVL